MLVDSFFHEETISLNQFEDQKSVDDIGSCPLRRWTEYVENLTKLGKIEHIRDIYAVLVEKLQG